jgi:hypothetical protein
MFYIKKENQDSIRYTLGKDCKASVTIENVNKNGQLENVASNIPQYPEIKSGLYKNKNKKFPTIQKTVNDLQMLGDFLLTETGLRFHLSHSQVMNKEMEHSLIFCSYIGLTILASSERWHCDENFFFFQYTLKYTLIYHFLSTGKKVDFFFIKSGKKADD